MTAKKITTILTSAVVLLLFIGIVMGASNTNPSKPTSMLYSHNRTSNYSMGDARNLARGYIHVINITESQPTIKWSGIVGNIYGEYALLDEDNNKLYDWTIITTTGEVYATKEGPSGRGAIFGGGMPQWENITCASHTMIKNETFYFNHSGDDEDILNKTFVQSFSLTSFFAGQTPVNDSAVRPPSGEVKGTDTCAGLNLSDGSDSSDEFQEVILTDLTYQMPDTYDTRQYDIIYASLIENDTVGYNGSTFDFQMILPQSGLEGDQTVVTYYFYVELV